MNIVQLEIKINTWRLSMELMMRIRPEARFGVSISWKSTFFNITTDKFNDVSSEKAYLANGKDYFQWFPGVNNSVTFRPNRN